MEFRKLKMEDLALFMKFYQDNPLEEDEEDLQIRREEIESELLMSKFYYFGIVENGILFAYGKLQYEGEEAHFIGPFVLPTHRRKGMGKKIVKNVETYCLNKGVIRLNAYSFIDTELAQNFLTNIGYKLESVSKLGVNVYIKKL
ncbi:MAG: GNAT family N-acetyltransferase [Promethearchaeota archaeon]|nr:MAG: GNAT family N-acetyltransferase [Candidatus Lokiarchaeota archaeon]